MNNLTKFIISSLFIFLFITPSFGQYTGFNVQRNIELNNTSKTRDIKINLDQNITTLNLSIEALIKKGILSIEIYNSQNEKLENFSIEGSLENDDTINETVSGQINKVIEKPIKGIWIIKIIPNNVTGAIYILSQQQNL